MRLSLEQTAAKMRLKYGSAPQAKKPRARYFTKKQRRQLAEWRQHLRDEEIRQHGPQLILSCQILEAAAPFLAWE